MSMSAPSDIEKLLNAPLLSCAVLQKWIFPYDGQNLLVLNLPLR